MSGTIKDGTGGGRLTWERQKLNMRQIKLNTGPEAEHGCKFMHYYIKHSYTVPLLSAKEENFFVIFWNEKATNSLRVWRSSFRSCMHLRADVHSEMVSRCVMRSLLTASEGEFFSSVMRSATSM